MAAISMGSLKMNKVTLAKHIKCDKAVGSKHQDLVEKEEPIEETEKKKSQMYKERFKKTTNYKQFFLVK